MMDQANLEHTLSGLPLAEIRFYPSLDSTNDVAADWACSGARDASLVVADRQRKGRGRLGRAWVTVPGLSLAFSLVLHPTPHEQAHAGTILSRFSGLGAVAVCQVLRTHYHLPASIKWPNDVLVAGRKISGVLAEAQWMSSQLTAVILGIGVNVGIRAVPSQNAFRIPATSLQAESGILPARSLVLRQILAEILHWRSMLMVPVFLQSWQDNLAYLGEWVNLIAITPAGEPGALVAQGQLLGLDPDGALRLRTLTGEEGSYRSGEIQLHPVDSFPK